MKKYYYNIFCKNIFKKNWNFENLKYFFLAALLVIE